VAGIAKQGRRLILPKAVLKEIDFKDRIRRNGAIDGSNKSDGASQVMASQVPQPTQLGNLTK